MELGQVLEPLHPFREKLLFIRGLYNAEALKGNIHSSQTGNLLSGAPLAPAARSARAQHRPGPRPAHRAQTKVPSLVLGCEKSNPSVHKNYSMLYSSHISWSSPTTPTPLELYPALAFDRLFRDEVGKAATRACSMPCWPTPADLNAADQHGRPAQARRVPRLGPRGGAAHRAGRQAGRAAGLAADAGQAEHPRPADGIPQDIDRAHAADVRHPRARLPDRHDARLHAEAEQRPLVAAVPHLGVDYMIHHLLSHSDSATG
jgi:hypothetical protein